MPHSFFYISLSLHLYLSPILFLIIPQQKLCRFGSAISGLLDLDTVDIMGETRIHIVGSCPVHCRMFNSFPGLYTLDSSSPHFSLSKYDNHYACRAKLLWALCSPSFFPCGTSLMVSCLFVFCDSFLLSSCFLRAMPVEILRCLGSKVFFSRTVFHLLRALGLQVYAGGAGSCWTPHLWRALPGLARFVKMEAFVNADVSGRLLSGLLPLQL